MEAASSRRSEIELILMDLRMPVMTGIEAARLVHERAETCRVPVVVTSAH